MPRETTGYYERLREIPEDKLVPRLAVFDDSSMSILIAKDYFEHAYNHRPKNITTLLDPEKLQTSTIQITMLAKLSTCLANNVTPQDARIRFDEKEYGVTFEAAQKIDDAAMCNYFLKEFSGYFNSSLRGQRLEDTPLTSRGIPGIIELSSALSVAINESKTLSAKDRDQLQDHFEQWSTWATRAFLKNHKLGFAGAMINFMPYSDGRLDCLDELTERIRQGLIDAPLSEMGKLQRYRTYRSHFLKTLVHEDLYQRFDALIPDVDEKEPEKVAAIERAAKENSHRIRSEIVTADLADYSSVKFAFEYYEECQMNFDGQERWIPQRTVHYDALNEEAQEAVRLACKAEKEDRDFSLHFREISLRSPQQPNARPQLYTVQNRVLPTENNFQYPVQTIETKKNLKTYLVVEGLIGLEDSHIKPLPWQVNLFGPKPQAANAFWLSGNARQIIGEKDDPDLMQVIEIDNEKVVRPRWVIIPIDYYTISTTPPELEEKPRRRRWLWARGPDLE